MRNYIDSILLSAENVNIFRSRKKADGGRSDEKTCHTSAICFAAISIPSAGRLPRPAIEDRSLFPLHTVYHPDVDIGRNDCRQSERYADPEEIAVLYFVSVLSQDSDTRDICGSTIGVIFPPSVAPLRRPK